MYRDRLFRLAGLRPAAAAAGAAAVTVVVCWAVLVILGAGDGATGTIGRFLGADVAGLAAAVAASTGAPVAWSIAGGAGGFIHPITFLLDGSPLSLLVVGPLAGMLVLWRLLRLSGRRPKRSSLIVAGAAYAAVLTGLVSIAARFGNDPMIRLEVPPGFLAIAAATWVLGTGLVATLPKAVPPVPLRRPVTRVRAALLALGVLTASVLAVQPAAARPEPGGERVVPFRGGQSAVPVGYRRPGVELALARLRAEQGSDLRVAHQPWRGTPSMIGLRSRIKGDLSGWLRANAGLFGIADPVAQVRMLREDRDPSGERHLWFEQHINGVPVLGARLGVHLDPSGDYVEFLTNALEPDLVVPSLKATVPPEKAVAIARLALPRGALVGAAKLYLLPTAADPGRRTPTVLAWRVWLSDVASGVSNAYFVDAHTGRLVYALSKAAHARDRAIWDQENSVFLNPVVARAEGDPSTGITDVDNAYDFVGDTYDYYLSQYGRDSYDGSGGQLTAVVRARMLPGEDWYNAMFVPGPVDTMYFGKGMTVRDVVAHEMTHGVTFSTADLWYMYQSGALNESFSDIFAEAVEYFATGSVDWLVGTGLPGGPLRSMEDPSLYGDPGHYYDFVTGCADFGGVHTNSGISNKAFYLLAQYIQAFSPEPGDGIRKAAKIAYRALTTYLAPRARFTDARVAYIESAMRLFGKGSQEVMAAERAWTDVGVNGYFEQPRQNCPCIADTSLTGVGTEGLDPQGPGVDVVLAALLHVKDLFADSRTPALRHYEGVYAGNSARGTQLMLADDELRKQTAHAMQTLQPALRVLSTPEGDTTTVTAEMLDEIKALLLSYAAADRAAGGGGLAERIDAELADADLDTLAGLSVNQVLATLDARVG